MLERNFDEPCNVRVPCPVVSPISSETGAFDSVGEQVGPALKHAGTADAVNDFHCSLVYELTVRIEYMYGARQRQRVAPGRTAQMSQEGPASPTSRLSISCCTATQRLHILVES